MKRFANSLLLPLLCVALLVGCSRTVTGGYEDSPDGRYRLWVRTFGAYGHAFSERTRKTIRIRLVERIGDTNAWDEKLLCEKTYHFKCADFDLKPLWGTNHNLTVVVYAWDAWEDATSDADAQKRGVASNYIATLTYDFDKNAGMFTEGK